MESTVSKNPPNILLITTDQQRTDTLGCYGADYAGTPHLDRLAREGTLFRRAYTVNPVCTPTRVSLFTGKMPSRHGAWNVGVNYRGGEMALSHDLFRSGYRTHYVGKAHFETFGGTPEQSIESLSDWQLRYPRFCGPYYGFETVELSLGHTTFGVAGHYGAWVRSQVTQEQFKTYATWAKPVIPESFGGEAQDWDLPVHLHSSVWTADRTIDFLQKHDRQKPFFLAVGFQDPHHPHAVPRDFTDRVDPAKVPLPDFTPGELEDKPVHFAQAHVGTLERSWVRGDYHVAGQGSGANFSTVSEAAARLGRAYYYSMVRLIDREMGRILAALDQLDMTRDTIVVFTTDHGELLGDHGLWMKGPFLYEQLVRVPLIVRWPGANPGVRTDALYSHVDLAPTFLAAAGVTPSERLDGLDLSPIFSAQAQGVRDHVIVECVDDPRKLRMKTVITQTRKLTWYCDKPFGELYDLELDPREKTNRWDDPAYVNEKAGLLSRIIASLEGLENRSPRHCYA